MICFNILGERLEGIIGKTSGVFVSNTSVPTKSAEQSGICKRKFARDHGDIHTYVTYSASNPIISKSILVVVSWPGLQ